MKDLIPPDLWGSLMSAGTAIGAGILGRMVWHARLSQKAERKFFSKHLLFELVVAVGLGFAADGVMDYFGFTGRIKVAGIIVISYLGPGGIEVLLVRYFKRPVKS